MTLRVPPAQVFVPAEDRKWILEQIDEALATGQLTLGRLGRQLEEEFASYIGVKHAIAVSSGTSALEIPLRTLEVAGGEVLVPANTFFATAAAVLAAGGRPKFVDCDPATMTMSPAMLEAAVGPDTVGAIIVHIGGLITPDIELLRTVCSTRRIWLLEDAAHAQGSHHGAAMAGTFGIAGAFSFYPTKVMTAGEGGMVVTNDDRIAEEARVYRDQGKAGFLTNLHTRLGYNWRMSEPHAAIALTQLRRLEQFIAHRQAVAARYDTAAADMALSPVAVRGGDRCNFYKYVAFLPDGVDRDKFKHLLREDYGVGLSGEVYETPLHHQPVFAPWADGRLPGAERACARHVCLPVSAALSDEQVDIVIESVVAAMGRS